MWFRRLRLILRSRGSRPTRASSDELSDGMVAVVRVIGENRNLQAWFRRIVALPDNLRVSEIGRLVSEMHANGEDRQTVDAFSALSDVATCNIVARMLLERYSIRI